ncbi:MAG: endonuclease/exonuclease/phosphatase family protein [Chitinispirillaceae bacterium]|nr:endonuclease/exonuclease/phosphatase family protein [Chitinispirillaceae bacterium]
MNKFVVSSLIVGGIVIGSVGVAVIGGGTQTTGSNVKPDTLTVCSFNIQFLGSFQKRDNAALADIVKTYDIVAVQELVSPPVDGTYPDGQTYTSDIESKAFFDAMAPNGFNYVLSSEQTGPGQTPHTGGTAMEWWVVFFKPNKVQIATDLPMGFISEPRYHNPDYQRVPYAFGFRTPDSSMDFVLIPVHLQPGSSSSEKERRKHELLSISNWVSNQDSVEKDFIILGDMNIYSATELANATPTGFLSLNDECRLTTTNLTGAEGGKPYDHVMYNPTFTSNEIDSAFDFQVINLVEVMKPKWTSTGPYPGDPYVHNEFRQYYSDHDPVIFRLIGTKDDDGVVKADCRKDCPKAQRISAKCKDGTTDSRTGSGACSGHQGVDCWECR